MVSVTPSGVRSGSDAPSCASSPWIATVTADCEMFSSIAAWLICPVSAAAMK